MEGRKRRPRRHRLRVVIFRVREHEVYLPAQNLIDADLPDRPTPFSGRTKQPVQMALISTAAVQAGLLSLVSFLPCELLRIEEFELEPARELAFVHESRNKHRARVGGRRSARRLGTCSRPPARLPAPRPRGGYCRRCRSRSDRTGARTCRAEARRTRQGPSASRSRATIQALPAGSSVPLQIHCHASLNSLHEPLPFSLRYVSSRSWCEPATAILP